MMAGSQTNRGGFGGFDFGQAGARKSSRAREAQTTHENLDVTKTLNVTVKDLFEQKPITVKFSDIERCNQCPPNGFCSVCGGTGFKNETKSIKVKLPLEVKEGQKIRVRGEGKGDTQGHKGDLYLIINIKDSEYVVDGVDLTKDVEITPAQAVLGVKKDIQTLHGNIGIKIPSKTSSGQMLRLKGLGLPKKSGYGNLNARIKIVIPKNISQKQIDLYRQLLELEKETS